MSEAPRPELAPLLREVTRRKQRPSLNVDAIVTAAIELADEGGLDAVSMSRVAGRLGCTTMALYRHVASKEELLALMLDAGAGAPPPAVPAKDWRSGLTRWCEALQALLEQHPWVLDVPIGPVMGPNSLAWLDRGLTALTDTSLSEPEKADIVLLLNGYVSWQTRLARDLGRPAPEGQVGPGEGLSATVRAAIDPAAMPALDRALAAGIFDDDSVPRHGLGTGIDVLLDGIAASIERASANSPASDEAGDRHRPL